MSLGPAGEMPPQIQTLLTIWNQTLNEAQVTGADAISAIAMMLGHITIGATDNEREAHEVINDMIVDVHAFINANYSQISKEHARLRSQLK